MSTARGAATSDPPGATLSLVAAPRAVLINCWCQKYLMSKSRPNVGVFVRYLLPPGTRKAIFVVHERFEVRIRVLDTGIQYYFWTVAGYPFLGT